MYGSTDIILDMESNSDRFIHHLRHTCTVKPTFHYRATQLYKPDFCLQPKTVVKVADYNLQGNSLLIRQDFWHYASLVTDLVTDKSGLVAL